MGPPTYGRIMSLVQDAHGGIRDIHASNTVQTPFVYVHMLAMLVHINNILNGISFGLTFGTVFGTILMHYNNKLTSNELKVSAKETGLVAQDLIISFFFSMFGPFVYHALLEVGINVSTPFGHADGGIPTKRLFKKLLRYLRDGEEMAKNTPLWMPPSFKNSG